MPLPCEEPLPPSSFSTCSDGSNSQDAPTFESCNSSYVEESETRVLNNPQVSPVNCAAFSAIEAGCSEVPLEMSTNSSMAVSLSPCNERKEDPTLQHENTLKNTSNHTDQKNKPCDIESLYAKLQQCIEVVRSVQTIEQDEEEPESESSAIHYDHKSTNRVRQTEQDTFAVEQAEEACFRMAHKVHFLQKHHESPASNRRHISVEFGDAFKEEELADMTEPTLSSEFSCDVSALTLTSRTLSKQQKPEQSISSDKQDTSVDQSENKEVCSFSCVPGSTPKQLPSYNDVQAEEEDEVFKSRMEEWLHAQEDDATLHSPYMEEETASIKMTTTSLDLPVLTGNTDSDHDNVSEFSNKAESLSKMVEKEELHRIATLLHAEKSPLSNCTTVMQDAFVKTMPILPDCKAEKDGGESTVKLLDTGQHEGDGSFSQTESHGDEEDLSSSSTSSCASFQLSASCMVEAYQEKVAQAQDDAQDESDFLCSPSRNVTSLSSSRCHHHAQTPTDEAQLRHQEFIQEFASATSMSLDEIQSNMWYACWSQSHMREYFYNPLIHGVIWSYWSQEEGKEFYWNEQTGVISWEKPGLALNGVLLLE